jgi:hypothetical protein
MMQGKALYIGTPGTAVEPVIQITNGNKAVITSIRLAAPTNNNGKFSMYHLTRGEVSIDTNQCIAHEVTVNSKNATEFLTHSLPVSPGESIYVSGQHISVAIYGVTFP